MKRNQAQPIASHRLTRRQEYTATQRQSRRHWKENRSCCNTTSIATEEDRKDLLVNGPHAASCRHSASLRPIAAPSMASDDQAHNLPTLNNTSRLKYDLTFREAALAQPGGFIPIFDIPNLRKRLPSAIRQRVVNGDTPRHGVRRASHQISGGTLVHDGPHINRECSMVLNNDIKVTHGRSLRPPRKDCGRCERHDQHRWPTDAGTHWAPTFIKTPHELQLRLHALTTTALLKLYYHKAIGRTKVSNLSRVYRVVRTIISLPNDTLTADFRALVEEGGLMTPLPL